jgi:apolipoprotein N-acyltransferase
MQAAEAARGSRRDALVAAGFGTAGAVAFALSLPLDAGTVTGWPLAFVWPAFLGAAARYAPSARAAALAVALPIFGALLGHQWWMHEITALGMPVLVVYLACWFAVLALVTRALGGSKCAPRWPLAVVLPIAFVSNEFLRGDLVCSGYAWFFVAHPLVEWSAFAQIAALGGGWLVTAAAAMLSGALVDGALGRGRARLASPLAALAVLAAALGFGHARLAEIDRSTGGETAPRLLVVQTNLPMSNKLSWSPEAQERDFLAFASQTLRGAAEARGPIDAAIWPETMVPGFGLESESIRALKEGRWYPGDRYLEALRGLSERLDAPLVVGSPAFVRLRAEGDRFRWDAQYNSAYLVDETGARGRTDKIFLTPFGETMPVISNSDWLEAQLLALGADGMTFDLDTAARPEVLRLGTPGAGVAVGVPICFEITAPWASRRIAFDSSGRRAEILLNLSNDGWFGWSDAGRRQHLQVARLRAIELDTAVVRCANTGISASIDRAGRVVAELPPRTEGTLVAEPARSAGVPLAAKTGDAVAWGALCAAVVGCGLRLRRRASRDSCGVSKPEADGVARAR